MPTSFCRSILIALAVVLLPLSVQAQTQTVLSVEVNKPFQLQAEHDGLSTAGYRVYVDGVKVGPDVTSGAQTAGVVTLPVAAVTARGDHTIQVAAYNADSEAKSDPVTLRVASATPNKPKNLRIVIVGTVSSNGLMTFELQELSQLQ